MTITAKYSGERGNDITIVIEENVDDPAKFDVITLVDGVEVDRQVAENIAGLENNDWVEFSDSGTGTLTENAGVTLSGGTDGTATNGDYSDFLEAIETKDFHTVALPSTDSDLKSTFAAFAQRLRDEEGPKDSGGAGKLS